MNKPVYMTHEIEVINIDEILNTWGSVEENVSKSCLVSRIHLNWDIEVALTNKYRYNKT